MASPAKRKNNTVEAIGKMKRRDAEKIKTRLIDSARKPSASPRLCVEAYLFKKYTITVVTIRFARASGSRNFQPKFISWSNLNRGNVPRTQM